MSIDYNKPEKSPVIISKDFFCAISPEVSYDGKSIIFSAQKNENDTWQIWEMKLRNKNYRQVTSANEDCFDRLTFQMGILYSAGSLQMIL